MDTTTNCIKCETTGLTWVKSVKGKWYLGYPVQHTFEDGNTTTTHYKAHQCIPTAAGLAALEARKAERAAAEAERIAKEEAAKAELAKLRHVQAELGDKVELTGTVTMATDVETQFGTSRLVVIKTDDYQVAKMFTTAEWAWDVDFDEVITIKGTVKSHDSYQNTPQTNISRPKKVA